MATLGDLMNRLSVSAELVKSEMIRIQVKDLPKEASEPKMVVFMYIAPSASGKTTLSRLTAYTDDSMRLFRSIPGGRDDGGEDSKGQGDTAVPVALGTPASLDEVRPALRAFLRVGSQAPPIEMVPTEGDGAGCPAVAFMKRPDCVTQLLMSPDGNFMLDTIMPLLTPIDKKLLPSRRAREILAGEDDPRTAFDYAAVAGRAFAERRGVAINLRGANADAVSWFKVASMRGGDAQQLFYPVTELIELRLPSAVAGMADIVTLDLPQDYPMAAMFEPGRPDLPFGTVHIVTGRNGEKPCQGERICLSYEWLNQSTRGPIHLVLIEQDRAVREKLAAGMIIVVRMDHAQASLATETIEISDEMIARMAEAAGHMNVHAADGAPHTADSVRALVEANNAKDHPMHDASLELQRVFAAYRFWTAEELLFNTMVDFYGSQDAPDAETVALVGTLRDSIVALDIRQTRPGVLDDLGRFRACMARKARAILQRRTLENRVSLRDKLDALDDTIANMLTPNANVDPAVIDATMLPVRNVFQTAFAGLNYVAQIQAAVTAHKARLMLPGNQGMEDEIRRVFGTNQQTFLAVIRKRGGVHTYDYTGELFHLNKVFVEHVINVGGIMRANTMFQNHGMDKQFHATVSAALGGALDGLFQTFAVHPNVAQRLKDKVLRPAGQTSLLSKLRVVVNRSLTNNFIKKCRDLFGKAPLAAENAVLNIMTPVCNTLRLMTGEGSALAQRGGLFAALQAPHGAHLTMKEAIVDGVLGSNMAAVQASWNAEVVNFDRLLHDMMTEITSEFTAVRAGTIEDANKLTDLRARIQALMAQL